MEFKRNLRRGMRGADVRYIKEKLLLTGSYTENITAIKNDGFGMDTLAAVRLFQRGHRDENGARLAVDGVIGRKTWAAIIAAQPEISDLALPPNIGLAAAANIAPALARVSDTRREMVLEALGYAHDPSTSRDYPLSLYIRGGNLYNTDLTKNIIDRARIESGAKRQPQYYNGGRKEMMLAAVRVDPTLTGADCSGGLVGLMRRFRLVKPSFDATADSLAGKSHSAVCAKDALRAGDWVGRSGHIGLFAGGGYVVEWVGGAYGCQLTRLDARRVWNFVTKKLQTQSAWSRYRKPEYY